jgi:hypothetical protein
MGCSLDAFKVWCQFEKEDWKTCINATKDTVVVVGTTTSIDYMVSDPSQIWSLTKLSRGIEQSITYRCVNAYGAQTMVGWVNNSIPFMSQTKNCLKNSKNTGTDVYYLRTRIPFNLPVVQVNTKQQGSVTLTVGPVCFF